MFMALEQVWEFQFLIGKIKRGHIKISFLVSRPFQKFFVKIPPDELNQVSVGFGNAFAELFQAADILRFPRQMPAGAGRREALQQMIQWNCDIRFLFRLLLLQRRCL